MVAGRKSRGPEGYLVELANAFDAVVREREDRRMVVWSMEGVCAYSGIVRTTV